MCVVFALFVCIGCTPTDQSSKTSTVLKPEKQSEEKITEEEEEWVPDVYKTSELAELMRQMHTDHLDLKSKIEAGETALLKTNDYSFIHKATPTDPNDNTSLFHTYADAYLLADSMVFVSKTTQAYKESFNNMVNSCVACHQNFCMGPINKIELLRIKM